MSYALVTIGVMSIKDYVIGAILNDNFDAVVDAFSHVFDPTLFEIINECIATALHHKRTHSLDAIVYAVIPKIINSFNGEAANNENVVRKLLELAVMHKNYAAINNLAPLLTFSDRVAESSKQTDSVAAFLISPLLTERFPQYIAA